MKTLLARFVALILAAGCSAEGFAQPIAVKVVVKIREKAEEQAGKPFSDVGGFELKRNNTRFDRAKCPDLSNELGEFSCTLDCDPKDGNLRLHLTSPGREIARIVAGLSTPTPRPIEIVACKVKTQQPIEVVYLGLDLVLSQFMAKNKGFADALTASVGGSNSQFIPFNKAAPTLEKIAAEPSGLSTLLELNRIAAAYQDAPPERKPTGVFVEGFAQYAIGINSIFLKKLVVDVGGAEYGSAVKLSGDSADLVRSVTAIERKLNAKSVLQKREIDLDGYVRDMKGKPVDAQTLEGLLLARQREVNVPLIAPIR